MNKNLSFVISKYNNIQINNKNIEHTFTNVCIYVTY